MNQVKKILAPTDFSENSRAGLKAAFSLAAETSAELLILHVADEFQTWEIYDEQISFRARPHTWVADKIIREATLDLNNFLERHREEMRQAPTVRKRVVLGNAAKMIVDAAREEDIDLIVMSPRPHGSWKRFFLGSVTDRVTREAPCPVLSVCLPERTRSERGKKIPIMPMSPRGTEARI
jgi:nucleotide-binding universal stress UspA family protein